jgi:hypothetical protein
VPGSLGPYLSAAGTSTGSRGRGIPEDVSDASSTERERLTEMIESQLAERDPCDRAGTFVLQVELRDRLAALGVDPGPDVSVALMAVAMLLAERAPEWGGDCRDALGEIAQLGLAFLVDGEANA